MYYRYNFFLLLFLINFNYLNASIIIDNLETAKDIGRRIADIVISNNKTKLDYLAKTVMEDHSKTNHVGSKSYFNATNQNKIKEILNFIINHATNYKVYNIIDRNGNNRRRLGLKINFSKRDSQNILQKNYIGQSSPGDYSKPNSPTNWSIVCFDINGINSIEDIPPNGATITSYPAEQLSTVDRY